MAIVPRARIVTVTAKECIMQEIASQTRLPNGHGLRKAGCLLLGCLLTGAVLLCAAIAVGGGLFITLISR